MGLCYETCQQSKFRINNYVILDIIIVGTMRDGANLNGDESW